MDILVEDKLKDVPWSQVQRLKFIERQLLWGRHLKTRMLTEAYGISRHQAGKDIKLYNILFPENIKPYLHKEKSHKPGALFKPGIITEDTCHVLEAGGFSSISGASIETLPIINRRVIDGVIAILLAAIEFGTDIETLYASASTPIGKKRTLRPLVLIYTANRLHVRAYCHEKCEYRDFVLSRMLTVPKFTDLNVELPNDTDFEETIDINVIANPALDNLAQALIEKEYQLDSRKSFAVKRCLSNYFLRANSLPSSIQQLEEAKITPWAYPVIPIFPTEKESIFFD